MSIPAARMRILVGSTFVLLLAACDPSLAGLGPESRSEQAQAGYGPPVLYARTGVDRCTEADAHALLNDFLGAVKLRLRSLSQSRLAEAYDTCQYRLYLDGETVVFREGDVFLGGLNLFWDFATLEALGATRAEAVDDIAAAEMRVWLAPLQSDGTFGVPVEPVLLRTPVKDGMHPELGKLLQQHRAFVTSLPAGEYLSTLMLQSQPFYDIPGEQFTATVRLVITSSP